MTTEQYRGVMIKIANIGKEIRELETSNPESEADKFNVLTKIREASHYLQDMNYREHPDQVMMAVDVKKTLKNGPAVGESKPESGAV